MREKTKDTSALFNGASIGFRLFLAGMLLAVFVLYVLYIPAFSLPDLRVYYDAARAMRQGEPVYGAHYGILRTSWYIYPPIFVQLFSVLTLFTFETVKHLWGGMNFVCLCLAALTAVRLSSRFQPLVSRHWRFATAFIAFSLFPPLINGASWGQVNVLILLLLLASLDAMSSEREKSAGLLLALAAMIKISPALLLLVPICTRQWKTVATFLAGCLLLEGCSLLLPRGPELFLGFFGATGSVLGGRFRAKPRDELRGGQEYPRSGWRGRECSG